MEKHTVPTDQIPYEIRRNPLHISLYKYSAIKNHKLLIHPSHKLHGDMKPFISYTNDIQESNDEKYVYVYRTMSLDNYGHFIIDNLIPLYKMIVLTQGYDFQRDNVLFCFLKAPKETAKQQTLTTKQKQLLSIFSSHPISFISEIPDQPVTNLVIPFLGLGKSIAFMKWKQYKNYNEQVSIEFLTKFRERVLSFFEITPSNDGFKKIFLSRKGAKHRRVTNEDDVISSLELTSISFKDKTIQEELQIFVDADLVITPYGAGIVGCYFMKPESRCIIMHPKGFGEQYDFPQIYVLFLKRLKVNVSVFHNPHGKDKRNIFRNRDSHMTIVIDEVRKLLSNSES